MHTEFRLLSSDLSQNTSDYLIDYWRLNELRCRHWSLRNPETNQVVHKKLYNVNLIMKTIWEELERRAEQFPTAALLLLIETGNSFSMNLNPKP